MFAVVTNIRLPALRSPQSVLILHIAAKMKYIKELDAIRALAIMSVITTHWADKNGIFYAISSRISAPSIFFTISGFLITAILIKERLQAEETQIDKLVVFKNFFIRRALRIFPAYYLTIFIVYLVADQPLSDYISHLTYTTNFFQHFEQSWGIFPHFWSMAVEEQFYLVWPWIILFTPKSLLMPVIVLFIAIGITSRIFLTPNQYTFTLPHTCFDVLGLGALLAWFTIFKKPYLPAFLKTISVLAIISLVCMLLLKNGAIISIANRTFVSIITTCILTLLVTNDKIGNRTPNLILNNPFLIAMGKLSYGLFLFHLPVVNYSYRIFYWFHDKLKLPDYLKYNKLLFLFENSVLLLTLAWLSWKFFERPIASLKKYYRNKQPATRRKDYPANEIITTG